MLLNAAIICVVCLLLGGLVASYLHLRSLGRRIDGLRADIAEARIEGVLTRPEEEPPLQLADGQRKRHLWIVPLAAFISGAVAWMRQHRTGTAAAGAAVAAVATIAVVTLASGGGGRSGALGDRPAVSSPTEGALRPPTARPTPAPTAPAELSASAPEPDASLLSPSDHAERSAEVDSAGPAPELSPVGPVGRPTDVPGGTPTASGPSPAPTSPSPRPTLPPDGSGPPADQDEEDEGLICLDLDLFPVLVGDLCLL